MGMSLGSNNTVKKCNRNCGQISIPANTTVEEILKLKREASDIWVKCTESNIYGQCKCELYEFLTSQTSGKEMR